MSMLELLDALVETLSGQLADGVGPLPVEKYRRLDRARGPVVYVTPVAQSESPVAIGGQFSERFVVQLRCEVPWAVDRAPGDLLLRIVDGVLAAVENHREIGPARRGRVGEVEYRYEARADATHAFVAIIPVEFTADKG